MGKDTRGQIDRFGGLSLGESTLLVDEVSLLTGELADRLKDVSGRVFLKADRGRHTFPVWVDHVGSAGTRYATGDLVRQSAAQMPERERMPVIRSA